jgi:putative ABC transport system substrate-binding protein
VKRREFITLLGGAAAAWPLAASAQNSRRPVVGLFNGSSPDQFAPHITALKRGLNEQGYVEGRHFDTLHLWADNRPERLPEIAAEMARQEVAVIATIDGGAVVTKAAKRATQTIPIVFVVAGDPVSIGLVGSINRPGSNITGVSLLHSESAGKRLELVRELLPQATTIGWIVNPNAAPAVAEARDAQALAAANGIQTIVLPTQTEGEVNSAFDALVEKRADALIVSPDAFVVSRRYQLAELATRHRIPVMYPTRDFPASGGLISYGTSLLEGYRQSGEYVARILRGAKPADLPILQLSKFEFVINLTAAKNIGLAISEAFLLRADEVIE